MEPDLASSNPEGELEQSQGPPKEILSNEEITQNESKKYTRTQWIALVTLAFGNFCVGACISIQAPFFPQEAERKGATPTQYGLIFGVYELTVFATAPLMGRLVGMFQPKIIMNSGIFTVGTACICFGLLDFVTDRSTFIALAFVVRILEGVGSAALQTACTAIIAASFPDSVATTFSYLATALGIGLITGPSLGGALFDAAGYGLPFYFMGSLMILNGLIILFALPPPARAEHKEKGNWIKFWLHPATFVYFSLIFSTFNYIGYNQATLEPHLRQFHLSGFQLGLVFMAEGVLYSLTAPFWGWLCDKKLGAKTVCIIGCSITVLSLLLIGPMKFLHLESRVSIVVVALCLKGFSEGAKLVSAYSGCLSDSIGRGFPSDFTTYGLVSSLFASSQSLGAFTGPSLGGYLLEHVGYDSGTLVVFGLEIFVMSLLMLYTVLAKVKSSKLVTGTHEERQPILKSEETIHQ